MPDTKKVTWINLTDPSEADLAPEALGLALHPLVVEDILSSHQRPKLERYNDSYTVLVAKPARLDHKTNLIETGEVALVVNQTHLISVCHGEAIPQLKHLVPTENRTLLDQTQQFKLVHQFLDIIVDRYLDINRELEAQIDRVEDLVFSAHFRNQSETIYFLKRDVLDLLRVVEPLLGPLKELTEWTATIAHHYESSQYFRDVQDHCKRLVLALERNSELLSDILSANLSQISIVQNNQMRRMSAWATIFMVPTLLASVWGMNFSNMPELEWRYGYPAAIGLMFLITVGLWLNFRRLQWVGPTDDADTPL